MRRQAVPDQYCLSFYVSAQGPKERHDLCTVYSAGAQTKEKTNLLVRSRSCKRSYGGQAFPGKCVLQYWSFAFRRPGPSYGRLLGKPALVKKDKGGFQAALFFLIHAQRCPTHPCMAFSSRSFACLAGFLQLQFN